jgi:glycyl-tRNA synthetase beta chain
VQRVAAVQTFVALPAAEALAAANKRIRNILRKSDLTPPGEVDRARFQDAEEHALLDALEQAETALTPLLGDKQYDQVLATLAELRPSVDAFFDQVLVNAEDRALRANRLALLQRLGNLFLQVADISRLHVK